MNSGQKLKKTACHLYMITQGNIKMKNDTKSCNVRWRLCGIVSRSSYGIVVVGRYCGCFEEDIGLSQNDYENTVVGKYAEQAPKVGAPVGGVGQDLGRTRALGMPLCRISCPALRRAFMGSLGGPSGDALMLCL